jgi:hypothetical protein
MNYKRRKPRRKVRCSMCTDGRAGNSDKAIGRKPRAQKKFAPKIDLLEVPEGLEK